MPKNNLKSQIADDLAKTGFPLEVYVANILNQGEWRTDSSPLYIDPDEKNTRELDIYAIKIYRPKAIPEKQSEFMLFSHLIIQCKKSEDPWVFFDNAGNDFFWLGFSSLKCKDIDFMSKLCLYGPVIDFTNHRYKAIKKHKSFHTAFKKPNQPSSIHEALITSCKALEYYKESFGVANNTAHFFTPMVVLDGTLWSATLTKSSRINLNQVNKLVVEFDYIFGDDKRRNKYTSQFIEVVTREEFERNLRDIEKDNASLLNSWGKFLELPHK